MTASLVVRCPGLAVDVLATCVIALPLNWLSRSDRGRCLGLPFHVTRAKERLVLAIQVFVRLEAPEFGCEVFKFGSALRNDHADGLVDFESHRHQFAGEFPAHTETSAGPVGFDYAL